MNYEEIVCDANNLYRAYKVSVKSSKWKESTQKFMMNFLRYIFEIHLHKYYQLYGNDGYILFGDFSKFYDNIIHEIAKRELLKLFNDDEFIDWLLTLIFKGFQIDVSYMSDEEYETCMIDTFNKLEYRNIPKEKLTGEKRMEKSVNIGDQLSQVIGIYYPYPIDNYVKIENTFPP